MTEDDIDLRGLVPSALELQNDDEANFIDLILSASELSEDEGEVRDLVDVMFEQHRESLADLREEHRSQI